MSRINYDGVIEAVHFHPNGQVDWVRLYERRGYAFSDLLIVRRQALVERLKAGKIIMIGQRIPYLAGTFKTSKRVYLRQQNGKTMLCTETQSVQKDTLDGAPVI